MAAYISMLRVSFTRFNKRHHRNKKGFKRYFVFPVTSHINICCCAMISFASSFLFNGFAVIEYKVL